MTRTGAELIADYLKSQDVDRVFGLCGGHIMPIWMALDGVGIRIVDVRDERAAVHMAHAHSELSGGLGVALITAGPGVTNGITGIANAHVARAPVFVLSATSPVAQENRGALQDMDQSRLLEPITRYSRTVRDPALILQELDEAVARAVGIGGDPGPVYLDFPVGTLLAEVPSPTVMHERFRPRARSERAPQPVDVERAAELLLRARRPLVITGRGARDSGPQLTQLLECSGAVYLDTGESRGVLTADHPSAVNAMRSVAMSQADVVVTVGRKLDFQLAYGSPAVFGDAVFIRISDAPGELHDNRRGEVEILASPTLTLAAIAAIVEERAGNRTAFLDTDWTSGLRTANRDRVRRHRATARALKSGPDGLIHPYFLLEQLRGMLEPDAVVVADGGDSLSFARVGLPATAGLDPGSFGCLGVGLPFAIAASLSEPDRQVVLITGDGALGFNLAELETAVRHRARLLVVVLNNGAWQIEAYDQQSRFSRQVGTVLSESDYAGVARALGMHAERVEHPALLAPAIERGLSDRAALLDVRVTPTAVSPDALSGLAVVPELQPLTAWNDAEVGWRGGSAILSPIAEP